MEFVTDIELTDYKGSYVEKTDSAVETHDLVASLLKPQHTPQCSCRNPRNILKKTFSSSLPSLHESCPNAKSWATYINMPENGYELYATLIHISLETPGVDSSIKQITLDSSRTFPDTDYYSNGDGKTVLIRLLTAFSKYNQTIGYVQGMNFIAATLLWHATEIDAFWLFVGLTEDYDLRESFVTGFPGLAKHCHILDYLMIEHMPDLYQHFVENGVAVQMFATDWCFTLFTSLVPIEDSHFIFNKFFEHKWMFFYKLIIEILDRLAERLLQSEDIVGILSPLKPYQNNQKDWKLFVRSLQKNKEKINWQRLAYHAEQRVIDEATIITILNEAYNRSTHDETGEMYFNKPL